MAHVIDRIVRKAFVRAPWLASCALALAGCVVGAPADVPGAEGRPLSAELRAHPSYQCLLASTDAETPLCDDGRYEEGVRSGRTLLPTAPLTTLAGSPFAMPRYHAPTTSFEARWDGATSMDDPVPCGEGCAASTRVRFVDDAGVLEMAVAIDATALDAIPRGTEVRVSLHEGLEVRRVSDGALVLAVLEDRAPGLADGESDRVPRRSFGPIAVEADERAVCNGFTTSTRWTCAKLYALDALAVFGGGTSARLDPGESATIATDEGTFVVRHRYGAHRIDAAAGDASCASCADREPSILSYEIVRID